MQNPEQNFLRNATRTAVLGLALTLGSSCVGEVNTQIRGKRQNPESSSNSPTNVEDFGGTISNFKIISENLKELPHIWQAMQQRRREAAIRDKRIE